MCIQGVDVVIFNKFYSAEMYIDCIDNYSSFTTNFIIDNL